jgi:L-threonylcarbamoyladenylate synthase
MLITLEECLRLLKEGKSPVAVPTDTTYGLVASLECPEALEAIYTLKGRAPDKPLPVLFADEQNVSLYTTEFPARARALATKHWPGPLTLILPANLTRVPLIVRGGLTTVGVRIPRSPLIHFLIDQVGPIVAPSANLSDKPPALCVEEVEKFFGSAFPVLPPETKLSGIPSTIVTTTNNRLEILREGEISRKMIALFQ